MTESPIQLFTIGFTRKSAEQFFTRLEHAGVRRLLDVRLNNVSQLAGFAKKDDLRFFLNCIANIEYVHLTQLAPTQDMLDAYKKEKGDWGFKGLKQAIKLEFKLGLYDKVRAESKYLCPALTSRPLNTTPNSSPTSRTLSQETTPKNPSITSSIT